MYFKATVLFSLAVSALALPAPSQGAVEKRAVLTTSNYADFQVSDGVAGNALAEVQAKFPVNFYPDTRKGPNPWENEQGGKKRRRRKTRLSC